MTLRDRMPPEVTELPPPPPDVLPVLVERIQQKLQATSPAINVVLVDVAVTEDGGNAALAIRTESGWDVKAWVGSESWENPALVWGVKVQKTWTW